MYDDSLRRLISQLARLPGIGEKTATRLAFYIINQPHSFAEELASTISQVRLQLKECDLCRNLTTQPLCNICVDEMRDQATICVVGYIPDLHALEASGSHRGAYHVLHGLLAPLDGVGPEELRIRELLARMNKSRPREVILAMNATVEGETTALYLNRLLTQKGIKVTRIASGIPAGSELEFSDQVTLSRALHGRREMP